MEILQAFWGGLLSVSFRGLDGCFRAHRAGPLSGPEKIDGNPSALWGVFLYSPFVGLVYVLGPTVWS